MKNEGNWDNKPSKALIFAAVGSLLVFITDLLIPLGVAVGVLYVVFVTLLIKENKKTIILISIVNVLLTASIPVITFDENTTWMAFVNRGISILAIYITASIVYRHSRLLEEKEKANITLAKQNKELEQFTFIASHDLQEPLRTIANVSSIIKEELGEKLEESDRELLDFNIKATKRMKTLITNLLNYSSTGVEASSREFNTQEVVNEIKEELGVAIQESKSEITSSNLPVIKGFETEFRVLLQNLILNAMKFKKKEVQPQTKISFTENNDYWTFAVQDNGIGIKKEYQDKIFGIFQRLHSKEEYSGTGIGLAHCFKITELHKGKIWVESEINQGSTFFFTVSKNL